MTAQNTGLRSGIDLSHRNTDIRPQDDLFGTSTARWLDAHRDPRRPGARRLLPTLCDQAETRRPRRSSRSRRGATPPRAPRRSKIGDLYASFMDAAPRRRSALDPIARRTRRGRDAASRASRAAWRLERVRRSAARSRSASTPTPQPGALPRPTSPRPASACPTSRTTATRASPTYAPPTSPTSPRMLGARRASTPTPRRKRSVRSRPELAAATGTPSQPRDAAQTLQPHDVPTEWAAGCPASTGSPGSGASPSVAPTSTVRRGCRPPARATDGPWPSCGPPSRSTTGRRGWAGTLCRRAPYLTARSSTRTSPSTARSSPARTRTASAGSAASRCRGLLGEAVGKLYVERHFPPAAKARMEELVANLIEAYRRNIDDLDWMSAETRSSRRSRSSQVHAEDRLPRQVARLLGAGDRRRRPASATSARAPPLEYDRAAA